MAEARGWELSPEMGHRLMANTALEPLGVSLTTLNEHEVILSMPITDAARQPMGMLHGGISLLLAESAASIHAAYLVDVAERVPVGIEINGSHLNSVAEGTVQAVGKVLRQSRSLIVHEVDLIHVESGKHLCAARVTNFYKPVSRE